MSFPFQLDWSKIEYISQNQYIERIKRYKPRKGDIIYSREGAILGIAAIINKDMPVALGQRLMLFSPKVSLCTSYYLWLVLNLDGVTRQVRDNIGGSASPHINVRDIKEFKIPVPPLPLQTRFAAIARAIEAQKALVQRGIAESQTLFDALMAQYFN